jgi:transposase
MNPVETLWTILKKRLGKMNCSTEEHMVTKVIKVWFHDSGVKNNCSKLVESMPKRVQQVILAKEDTFISTIV